MNRQPTRRDFLISSAAGVAFLANTRSPGNKENTDREISSPREIWAACVTNQHISPKTQDDNINEMLKRMEKVLPYQPDIVCLPETLPDARIRNLPPLPERAETVPGEITERFSEFAENNNCYIILPMHTQQNGIVYNSAVLIGRKGRVEGMYHKMNTTEYEMNYGVTPGPKTAQVFETDFGIIGIQICFDANWTQNWLDLKQAGAEIIFFPSAFDGGRILNMLAWTCNYYIVACTWRIPGLIIDITGDELHRVDYHQNWLCAPVNLEKELFHMDYQMDKIKDIQEKYGRKVVIRILAKEGCVTIESCSKDVTIKGLIEEYKLVTYDGYIKRATEKQKEKRI